MQLDNLVSDKPLMVQGKYAKLLSSYGIHHWGKALAYICDLPYGRNSSRTNFSLVMIEGKGTCSSKHALAKAIALEQGFECIDLVMCLYKMTEDNTPSLGDILSAHGLAYIPEAHCYLLVEGEALDITQSQADFASIQADILYEQVIQPEQVSTFKVDFHQNYIKEWIHHTQIPFTFEELWTIREKCIQRLENE